MGGGMGGGGMRGGGGGMRGGRGRSAGTDGTDRATRQAERMLANLSHLSIHHEGAEFDVTDAGQISRSFQTDGRTRKVWTQQGEVPASAVREDGAVVVTYGASGRFAKRVRRYELSPDGEQLLVTEQRWLAGREEPLRFKLVYRRADGNQ